MNFGEPCPGAGPPPHRQRHSQLPVPLRSDRALPSHWACTDHAGYEVHVPHSSLQAPHLYFFFFIPYLLAPSSTSHDVRVHCAFLLHNFLFCRGHVSSMRAEMPVLCTVAQSLPTAVLVPSRRPHSSDWLNEWMNEWICIWKWFSEASIKWFISHSTWHREKLTKYFCSWAICSE